MQRREARLRKEYLYRKSLEEKEQRLSEKKSVVEKSLSSSAPIPLALKTEVAELTRQVCFDHGLSAPKTSIDDEYMNVKGNDPKILITTSRDPSSRLQQFAKEMRLVFPNSQRINRGNYIVDDIVKACKSNEVTDLVILHEHRGIPDSMIISHFPYGPTAHFSLHNVVLRHDLRDSSQRNVSEAFPHLIFHNFVSKLGYRVKNILQHLFPVPKDDSKRVLTFSNREDFISFRHHTFSQNGTDPELTEAGPRFEMRPYEIRLGTLDMADADLEWSLRPYMNTSKKRDAL